jgi:RNA-binding protein YhbY
LAVAPNFKDYLHKERLKQSEIRIFKQMLTEENLNELQEQLERKEYIKEKNTVEIDTWINEDPENRKLVME